MLYHSRQRILLLLTVFFLLAGCACTPLFSSSAAESLPAQQSESPEKNSSDSPDLDKIYDQYFWPVFFSSVTAESWDDPEQLEPDTLVHYYLARHYYDLNHPVIRDHQQEEFVEQEVLEQEVMSHFEVSQEFLRRSQDYDADRGVYVMKYLGGAASSKVVGATWKDDLLLISFEYYSPADDTTVIRRGNLQMQFSGEEYQYISCSSIQVIEG